MCEHVETSGQRRRRRLLRLMTAKVVRQHPAGTAPTQMSMRPWA